MRNTFFSCFFLAVCTFSVNAIIAQSSSDAIVNQFFNAYETSPIGAIDYVFSTNVWLMQEERETIDSLKTQLREFVFEGGAYNGYEEIKNERVGNNFRTVSFMAKYDKKPIKFTFVLYNPRNKWQILKFSIDYDMTD